MTDASVRDARVKDSSVPDVIRIECFNGMSGYPHQVAYRTKWLTVPSVILAKAGTQRKELSA